MNIEQIFNQIGISPLRAVDLMESLDISVDHLGDPYIISKLESIIKFMKNYDDDSQRFLIKKATFGKQDKLKVMTEYIRLIDQKNFFEKSAKEIEIEKSNLKDSDDLLKVREIQEREAKNNAKLSLLKEEIELYHK